jgi:type IV pilus assembly protein PilW
MPKLPKMIMTEFRYLGRNDRGLSLIELMIALTIGLLLVTGLSLIFVNSSQATRELQKTAQQIENGRYSMDILGQDLRLAGFYGHLHVLPPVPAALPDPCESASTANLEAALAYPVQGYRAPNLTAIPDVTASTCDDIGLLVAGNLRPGSDVVVIRRASTVQLALTGTAALNELYIQATSTQSEIQIGNGAVIGNNKANGTPSTFFLHDGITPAPIRKFRVHVYFVAPCSVGSGANGICQAGDDAIPTLKRLELVSVGGAAAGMRLVPLVEGIEYLKLEYGVDNIPVAIDVATGVIGDATVDSYATAPADWSQVISARVYVLARNTDASSDFTDDKSYTLGTALVPAANDRFKRHAYASEVRLMSPSGRREIP